MRKPNIICVTLIFLTCLLFAGNLVQQKSVPTPQIKAIFQRMLHNQPVTSQEKALAYPYLNQTPSEQPAFPLPQKQTKPNSIAHPGTPPSPNRSDGGPDAYGYTYSNSNSNTVHDWWLNSAAAIK